MLILQDLVLSPPLFHGIFNYLNKGMDNTHLKSADRTKLGGLAKVVEDMLGKAGLGATRYFKKNVFISTDCKNELTAPEKAHLLWQYPY